MLVLGVLEHSSSIELELNQPNSRFLGPPFATTPEDLLCREVDIGECQARGACLKERERKVQRRERRRKKDDASTRKKQSRDG